MRTQIHAPEDPTRHGALACPACNFIHGRCLDALYPFLHLARKTGDRRYVTAATGVMAWAERNVAQPNGSWTVIADPMSWGGVTVFGAIALADGLRFHGDLLDDATREDWTGRLRLAADYVYRTFTIDFTNINYPATAVYALHLFAEVLQEPAYAARARELAPQVLGFLSTPSALLTGEGKPSNRRSARGLPPVDFGYNVEESLVALALYAAETGDAEFTQQIMRAWRAHLAFMLPDGAWDNSWGTRHPKWTYWGSRTSDGAQPGLAVLAPLDPVFGAAAIRNTELMRACTRDGLLYGGPHYAAAGAPPCVHHTFSHAKAITAVLDRGDLVDRLNPQPTVPRAMADGVQEFPEVAVWLAARGPWRATVSSYDFVYRQTAFAPTGGALSMLWHERAGPLCAGSMARYFRTEPNNMQEPVNGRDDPLTLRIEFVQEGRRYCNTHDLDAQVQATDASGVITITVDARLQDEAQQAAPNAPARCRLVYTLNADTFSVQASLRDAPAGFTLPVRLIVPVIATQEELLHRTASRRWHLAREHARIAIESSADLMLGDTRPDGRIFSLVPGFLAVPVQVDLPLDGQAVELSLRATD